MNCLRHGHENTPRVGSAVVLTCSSEAKAACGALAQQLAQWYWDRRAEFTYPLDSPTTPWHQALEELYAAFDQGQKVLLGDLGDNANAGTSGAGPQTCQGGDLSPLEALTTEQVMCLSFAGGSWKRPRCHGEEAKLIHGCSSLGLPTTRR